MSQLHTVVATLGVGIFILGAFAVGGVAGQDDMITVEVNLVDQNGDGVGNAELTATWDGGADTDSTTSSGLAFLEVPEGADLTISMDHPEYVRNQPFTINNATVPAGDDRLQVEIPASLSGTVSLTVEDDDGPVEGVTVRVQEDFGPVRNFVDNVQTSPNGVAETRELERGSYTVRTSKPRYLDTESTIVIDDNEVSERIHIEESFVDLTINVTDDHFDPPQPLADARLEIEGDTISTRGDGTRTTDVAVNDRYEVTVTRDGYQSTTETVSVGEEATSLNVSIQRTPELNVESSQQRIVIGESTTVTVTNAYGEPVEGVTVSLAGSEVGQTDSDGQLDVEISTPGSQEISVSQDGLSSSVTVEGFDPDADDDTEVTDDEPEDDDSLGPGFGVGAALVALLAVALLVRRR